MKWRSAYLHILEAHAHHKVSGPVGEAGHGEGGWAGALAEQLGHDKPGNGAGPDLEERHKGKDGDDADIRHPLQLIL